MERIVRASSNENDIVLDAFCGCGTALVAAQKLKRQWIGIDISPTACRVMAKRLKKDCGLKEDEKLWEIGRDFGIDGRIYPVGAMPAQRARETGEMEFMDVWYPVQVKQRDKSWSA